MAAIGMPTKEDYAELFDDDSKTASMYCQATEDITAHLEKIFSQAQTFEELKDEISNFIKDRKDFIAFALPYKGPLKDS